jgi:hypothetical protein
MQLGATRKVWEWNLPWMGSIHNIPKKPYGRQHHSGLKVISMKSVGRCAVARITDATRRFLDELDDTCLPAVITVLNKKAQPFGIDVSLELQQGRPLSDIVETIHRAERAKRQAKAATLQSAVLGK